MNELRTKNILRYVSMFGLIICAILAVWAWQRGILTSQQAILPGGISCLAGVLILGSWLGFLFNYIGICVGSMIAFLIARHFGRPVLRCLFRHEQLARYDQWMQSRKHLSLWLAIAIFFRC